MPAKDTRTASPDRISTVRGDIDADSLGMTLTHEHLFVWNPEFHRNFPELWDSAAGVERAAQQLEKAYELGIRTIVDLTVLGQGRDPQLIAQVAEKTRVNIVLATGIYALDGLPQIVRYRGPGEILDMPDPLVDLLESDIRDGIAGTTSKASLVKFACEDQETGPTLRRVAAAVAEVHRRTGVPVVVHTDPERPNALLALDLLAKHGVDAADVVLAHAGDITDTGYLREVAGSGAYIGCDRFGMVMVPEEQRVSNVLELVAQGHLRQLLLSHDCASFIDHFPEEVRQSMMPDWSYDHLPLRVIPALRRAGLTDGELTALFEDNPRRLLTGRRPADPEVPHAG
ncbi:phosphotriesterase-related protein [Streptomyces sp. NPDC001833]|uniref:phosphotriesterase family protein n=1 Tax=Streptomyces sp. NPDC001833 TaxID=3154658 RepID=UPI003329ADBE